MMPALTTSKLTKAGVSLAILLLASPVLLWFAPGVDKARREQAAFAPAYKAQLLTQKENLLDAIANRLESDFPGNQQEERAFQTNTAQLLSQQTLPAHQSTEAAHIRPHETYIWLSDPQGEFVYGTPALPFRRLNDAFDRQKTLITNDRFYSNRDAFLSAFIHKESEIDFDVITENNQPAFWRFDSHASIGQVQEASGIFLISRQIIASTGELSGTLFLKVDDSLNQYIVYADAGEEQLKNYRRYVYLLRWVCVLMLWIIAPSWVYTDATNRHIPKPVVWGLATVFSFGVGLIIYLASRPSTSAQGACKHCLHRVAADGEYCPYCGQRIATTRCPACETQIQHDWRYCPSCRLNLEENTPNLITPI